MLKLSMADGISSAICATLAILLTMKFGQPHEFLNHVIVFSVVIFLFPKHSVRDKFADAKLWVTLNLFVILMCGWALIQLLSDRPFAYGALAAGLMAASGGYLRLYFARIVLDRNN